MFRNYNNTDDGEIGKCQFIMKELFKEVGKSVWIELDFKCEYGKNITINDDAYINFVCGILDYVEVITGKNMLIELNAGI